METRANYVLIGAFTLAGILGLLGFLLWFARVELDRQFAYYDISFPSVSGLGTASDVRFSGLPVGQVVDVRLSPEGDGTVRVRIEVGADTPVRTDSIATIESQGVTGVSFVGLSAGTPGAARLEPGPDGEIPRIQAGQSVLQTLSEDAPALLKESLDVVRELNAVLGGENRGRVDRILMNIEGASSDFAQSLADFSAVAGSVSEFAVQIDSFNATLADLTDAMTGVLATADGTLESIGTLAEEAQTILSAGNVALAEIQGTAAEARRYVAEDLTGATADVRLAVGDLRREMAGLSQEASTMIDGFGATGAAATARLNEAQGTIEAANAAIGRLDATLTAVERAATSVDALVTGEGTSLVVEARTALASARVTLDAVGAVARTDLPAVVADIRSATATVAAVAGEVGADLRSAGDRIEGLGAGAETALAQVTQTFANANATLTAIDTALATGNRALAAAERAFTGADRVMNEDVAGIAQELRASLAGLNAAIAQVSADLPGVTADLRAASTAAQSSFEELERVVGASGGSVERFTATALPAYASLAAETRALIDNLDGLVTQIGRDPARFLLNQQSPEFQR
ncbi:MlaD family protein [Rubellimicrobium aerolatum]|uniref:MlaD family protein n=1 Tax=Rubellimicrobium aerolatum TaxID=490979 RepID=A0ABW0SA76_9RHOB|nr:MlaD family protein [Rubellimicrobium aerolatum]MBP1805247.1 phospholipid/cholesterol/gamma-HCH transport system substrate-binding protein [Rubellimicrobium aerolatum]